MKIPVFSQFFIVNLIREPKGRYCRSAEKNGGDAMVSIDNLFTFVIMLCAVITLVILIDKHKK